jgi:hypothetical protein
MPGAEFQAGNLTIAIMDPTAFGQECRPHSLPIALQVDVVPQARTQLEARGVQFVTDLIDSGVCHQAIFLDPAATAWASTTATPPVQRADSPVSTGWTRV